MSASAYFDLADWGGWILPVLVTILIALIPWTKRFWVRALAGIVVGWLFAGFYNIYIYNPAGIAYGRSIEQDFPEGHYDNNTTAVTLLIGWVLPALACVLIGSVRLARAFVAKRNSGAAV